MTSIEPIKFSGFAQFLTIYADTGCMGLGPKLSAWVFLWAGLCPSAHAYQACFNEPAIASLAQVTTALQQPTQKPDFSRTNIPAFCKENAKAGVADAMVGWDDALMQSELDKKYKKEFQPYQTLVDQFVQPVADNQNVWYLAGDRWLSSTYPDLRTRMLNHFQSQGIGSAPIITSPSLIKQLPTGDSHIWKTADQARLEIAKQDRAMRAEADQSSDIQTGLIAKTKLCGTYSGGNTLGCIKALGTIVDAMHPVESINLWDTVKQVLADPVYVKAAKALAIKIETKVETPGVVPSDLYTDTVQSFLSNGESKESAEEKAFNLLAVYSTHGPNSAVFFERFLTRANSPLYHALSVIGTGITVLNSRTQGTGHQYSYPPGVGGGCDNGKPYHFWMTAYHARKGAKQTGNAKAGRSAAFISNLGYQMLSETYGRDPKQVFTHECYDASNNKIRMDVTFAAAGATFGANSATHQSTKINMDEGLRTMLTSSTCPEKLSPKDSEGQWSGITSGFGLAGFNRWSDTFAPEQVFEALK